ncbi:MAG TPA: FAD-dependent oxidoreductase [Flavihumibacter sp.]|nr:FAD-dependent oxidoreductase [Bacteroidota bacterium]HOA38492.1 FAD-dependent oxidoreductase [Flavihumibacter sp.]HPZ86539.1 FAD-dependent oxidoreductase [Flavihumibacter sp.]HQD08639.1 FAD-dependent oxidoreductase [Flavihumibacter sp.]
MLQPWQTGTVIRIQDEAVATRRFWIRVDETNPFDFKPGQFITLDLPIHEQRNKRWRSYSIASWPDNTNVIELVIVRLDGGAGTQYLFDEIQVGSLLTLRGPQGVFTLPEPIEKDVVMICTGTGIAPFRSMVHHILNNNIPHAELYLIFGCRYISNALYQDEMRELMAEVPSFHYFPIYSRETSHDHLVRRGYVHAVYEELCAQKKAGSASGSYPANFFLCGWREMIDEARTRLQALGYDKKDIHLELYG